jgi:Flp pilus assembly protein protease CpaA
VIVAISVLALIAYSDVRSRRISNALSLSVAILGLIRIVVAHEATAAQTLAAASIAFVLAFLLFWRGVIGGGDAKLIAATVLLVGWKEVPTFLLLMSVCGAVLALTTLLELQFRSGYRGLSGRVRNSSEAGFANPGAGRTDTVPYGVAIAVAGVVSLVFQSPFVR